MSFKQPTCTTYDKNMDNFKLAFLIVPCAVLALLINEEFSLTEVMVHVQNQSVNHSIIQSTPIYLLIALQILWTFSIYLEAVAIIPQLIVVHKYASQQSGWVENLTSHYVFTLGAYRVMYLINWIYRFATEKHYRNWIVWIAGVIQTLIYCDFFYYYLRAIQAGQNVQLPL